jgi:hypothetical protein
MVKSNFILPVLFVFIHIPFVSSNNCLVCDAALPVTNHNYKKSNCYNPPTVTPKNQVLKYSTASETADKMRTIAETGLYFALHG